MPSSNDAFSKGPGFYLVKYNGFNGLVDEVYFLPKQGFYFVMGQWNVLPDGFIDIFDNGIPKKEDVEVDKMVSESFALKAMALAKANTQSIKISDILK
tara:strand:+ start:1118 stop:1411 length:294 start_codon:yes stop_codon:yes gene_type:complete